jgi:hypothetical protein
VKRSVNRQLSISDNPALANVADSCSGSSGTGSAATTTKSAFVIDCTKRPHAGWRDRIAHLPVRTPAGRRIAICPATYTDATCKSCGACAEPREAVIGFPAHGAWRTVEKAIAARDVAPGESWAFREHRTMAEVIAKEKSLTA